MQAAEWYKSIQMMSMVICDGILMGFNLLFIPFPRFPLYMHARTWREDLKCSAYRLQF